MNQRIKELAEQATTRIDPTAHDGVCWDFDKEKFAELIVKDCMSNLYLNGYDDAMIQIQKHFGVEL